MCATPNGSFSLIHLECRTKLYLGFLLDGSGSINKYDAGNFQKCLGFVKSLAKAFPSSSVGTIVFSYRSELKFGFNQYKTPADVQTAIDRITYPGHSTYTGKGLKMASEKLFKGVTKGIPRVLIVITDGKSHDDVTIPSEELKRSGVIVISVGMGKHFNKAQLYVLASNPKEDHAFTVDFSQMSNIITAIQQLSCKGKC